MQALRITRLSGCVYGDGLPCIRPSSLNERTNASSLTLPSSSSFERRRRAVRVNRGPAMRQRHVLWAAKESSSARQSTEEEFIEVSLEKPLGLKFARGSDSGAYVVKNDPTLGNTDPRIEIGDKVDKVSATFGNDIWDAKNFGQIIYAIRTRNGKVYLKFKRMYGDMSALEDEQLTDDERMWKREQAGGNVGLGTRQIQERNYLDKKQEEKDRKALFATGMKKFDDGNVDAALIDFENVIARESAKYMGDNFARVSDVGKAAQYNAACCYSMLGQIEAGLEALETALRNGFDDYGKIRTDPNLEKLRDADAFDDLMDQYDEPVLNENAMKVIRGLFSFGKD